MGDESAAPDEPDPEDGSSDGDVTASGSDDAVDAGSDDTQASPTDTEPEDPQTASTGDTSDEMATDDESDEERPEDDTGASTELPEETVHEGDDEESDDDGDGEDDSDEDSADISGPPVTKDVSYDSMKTLSEYEYDLGGGPSEDSEMPLADHLREMVIRLTIVIAVAGAVSVLTYPFTEEIINFLWDSILTVEASTRPRLYGVLELLFTKLKVAGLSGLIIALPVVVYQTYRFMRPGLYPHERRYYLAAVPTSLVLALLGVSFAYFVVLPAIFVYFLHYSEGVAVIGFALGRTFDLILVLMGYLAVVFQIPLFILLAMMMGVVTRQWLADRRLLFWAGFLGISFLFFGPADPTGAAPFLVTLTMIFLFEGTLFLVKWTRKARRS